MNLYNLISNIRDSIIRWKKIIASWKKNIVLLDRYKENFGNGLMQEYSDLMSDQAVKRYLRSRELKIFSQHGEDGLIAHFMNKIGAKDKIIVEFGIGDGKESNAANLIINFGWKGVLIEGDKERFEEAERFYKTHPLVDNHKITILNKLVTAKNIDGLLSENLSESEIDILSIDIDGNDYWIWQAIKSIRPRLLVIEYNSSLGREKSVTIPYEPMFDRYQKHPSGFYHGATLPALISLSNSKGYKLVGCESHGVNAFFVRADLIESSKIKELSFQEAFYPNRKRGRKMSIEEQMNKIKELELIEI